MAGFQREDSIYHDLIAWGLEFQIRRMDSIEIPRYLGDIEFTYATAYRRMNDMWLPLIGILFGIILGMVLPINIPTAYSSYMSIAVLAALDSVFGGIRASHGKTI
jgi:tetrahydromethanopterin S-methyltransferase subunit G